MPTPGRNDPCSCGSGQKYKRCCMARDEAASAAQRQADAEELRATQKEVDELDAASNAVIDLIDAGRLDDAEQAARELLVRYPEVHDGHDRLGRVYEARGQPRQAADCYRQVLAVIRAHADDYDPRSEQMYLALIARLDPPVAS